MRKQLVSIPRRQVRFLLQSMTTEAFMNKQYEIMKLRHSIEIAKKMITQSDKRKEALVNDLKLGIKEMEREIKKLEK